MQAVMKTDRQLSRDREKLTKRHRRTETHGENGALRLILNIPYQ